MGIVRRTTALHPALHSRIQSNLISMNPLVTPTWLAAHLQNPNTIILDATLPPVGVTPTIDTHARYLANHIPGAIFFDIEALSDHTTSLPHMLPTAEAFSRSMSALGIADNAT